MPALGLAISLPTEAEPAASFSGGVPANALLDVDGNPIRDLDGNYILTD